MKKIILLLMIFLCFSMVACGNTTTDNQNENSSDNGTTAAASENTENASIENNIDESSESIIEETGIGADILVVYFSATGNTKRIAEYVAEGLDAELYEITPEEPYTDEDLDYNNDESRSTQEMNDPSARPAIVGKVENMEQYDTIILAYPIWWGEAPRILDTFVENYDFTGKTIVPFCTSGGSEIGNSADTLASLANTGEWMDGKSFSGNESSAEVMDWVNSIGIN